MDNEIYQLDDSTAIYHRIKEKFCRKIFKQLFPAFKTGDTIVEIGPGQGHFAAVCKKKGLNRWSSEIRQANRGGFYSLDRTFVQSVLTVKVFDGSIKKSPLR